MSTVCSASLAFMRLTPSVLKCTGPLRPPSLRIVDRSQVTVKTHAYRLRVAGRDPIASGELGSGRFSIIGLHYQSIHTGSGAGAWYVGKDRDKGLRQTPRYVCEYGDKAPGARSLENNTGKGRSVPVSLQPLSVSVIAKKQ